MRGSLRTLIVFVRGADGGRGVKPLVIEDDTVSVDSLGDASSCSDLRLLFPSRGVGRLWLNTMRLLIGARTGGTLLGPELDDKTLVELV